MLKVLSTVQPNPSESRAGNTMRRPSGPAQHGFLQTLLLIGISLFTVKRRCSFHRSIQNPGSHHKGHAGIILCTCWSRPSSGHPCAARQMAYPLVVWIWKLLEPLNTPGKQRNSQEKMRVQKRSKEPRKRQFQDLFLINNPHMLEDKPCTTQLLFCNWGCLLYYAFKRMIVKYFCCTTIKHQDKTEITSCLGT